MDETDQSVGINWKLQAKTFVNHPALSTQHPAPSTQHCIAQNRSHQKIIRPEVLENSNP
jgi:hypothetical protein